MIVCHACGAFCAGKVKCPSCCYQEPGVQEPRQELAPGVQELAPVQASPGVQEPRQELAPGVQELAPVQASPGVQEPRQELAGPPSTLRHGELAPGVQEPRQELAPGVQELAPHRATLRPGAELAGALPVDLTGLIVSGIEELASGLTSEGISAVCSIVHAMADLIIDTLAKIRARK